jgi:DNA recombination protein RmuC
MTTILLIGVLAFAAAAAFVWLARLFTRELAALRTDNAAQLADRNAQVDRRLHSLVETMDRRLAALDTKVDNRLESASRTTAQIHERLGKVDEATSQVLEQAKAFGRLEHALRPPKARGGFGELLLGNLLGDRLPRESFQLQYGFRSGERVDAVIRVDRLVPIDAKFPLENFERLVAAEDEAERTLYEKAFARDLKAHVDSIATKYIRPEEGTYDFALMYLPAEAVYYELVAGRTGQLLAYSHEKRVFPVSPATLYAQLQVIALGLRGLQIEKHAEEVMAYCAQLQRDFARFKEDFDVVGKHLGNAHTKYGEAERRLDRFEGKLEQASDQQSLDEPTLPRALDAA